MRILQITAGTGSFYCGTCLRDHTLVQGLQAAGHDAVMVPLYLPIVTETPIDYSAPLFFGGINVYLQQKFPLFRRTPQWIDRILDAKLILNLAAQRTGMTKPQELGELTLSTLNVQNGPQIKELERFLDWLAAEPPPDVVCLSNALLMGFAAAIQTVVKAPVVCSLQGEDSFLDSLPPQYAGDCWQRLSELTDDIAAFIAVSRYYGDRMRDRLNIPREKLHVVYNGISLNGWSTGAQRCGPPVIGYLTQMIPGKGLESLVDAFISLKQKDTVAGVQLHAAGSLTAVDRPFVKRLKAKIAAADVADDVQFFPNIERQEKLRFLQTLTILSVPATYGEAFGLYIIEALAMGVPVVQPRHAAFPEIIELTNGGVLYDPSDAAALVNALESLLLNEAQLRRLGDQGKKAVFERFGAEHMARNFLDVLIEVTA